MNGDTKRRGEIKLTYLEDVRKTSVVETKSTVDEFQVSHDARVWLFNRPRQRLANKHL